MKLSDWSDIQGVIAICRQNRLSSHRTTTSRHERQYLPTANSYRYITIHEHQENRQELTLTTGTNKIGPVATKISVVTFWLSARGKAYHQGCSHITSDEEIHRTSKAQTLQAASSDIRAPTYKSARPSEHQRGISTVPLSSQQFPHGSLTFWLGFSTSR